MASTEPTFLPALPREVDQIERIDSSLLFPAFTADIAWTIGTALRTRLLAFPKPTVIDISLAHGSHCLFHATTRSGTSPDNDSWVARKRNTVLRFACSTWLMHHKMAGDEQAFAAKYALGPRAAEFAIHGGGWPVRVRGVDGVVAVIVVSGLKQDQDAAVIVQVVGDFLKEMGEKKKDD